MRIAIGCDHRGFNLKKAIMEYLTQSGHIYEDFGCYNLTPVDYPDVAIRVSRAVAQGRFDLGILICSTGIGMSIVANKIASIRAALCQDIFSARRAKEHNNANILCLGESIVGAGLAQEIVKAFLSTEFEGGRHARRLDKITLIEKEFPTI